MTQALNYLHGIRAFPFVRFTACMPIFSDSLMILIVYNHHPPPPHTQPTLPFSEKEHDTFVLPVLIVISGSDISPVFSFECMHK